MASARAAWGIDIGNRALKAVKLVRDGDQLKVDDFELIEHEHVLSNAGDNRESLIQTSLANFVQRHQLKNTQVAVGVSGQQSFARFIKLPPVEPKKIPEIVKFEAIQQIPFPLDDVEWSYQLFQTPESPDVEVGIFAMRKDLISRYIQFFTDVDLNVQAVQMNPLAVYNAVFYDQRLKGTTMLVDLGAENTDLIICDNDSVWMRSIPIGGNNFTETLVKAFKLPFAKAEDLKRNAATSKYARQIFQAMRPVFADLVAEIQRSVGFFASVHRDSRIKKIIALGGTFRLPGLQKYLQQNLSLDVERLDNIAAGAPTDPKLAATFNENLLSVISAYGLALQVMGEGKITSSLLPASIRREKMWKEKVPFFAAAAATFCIGTSLALGGYFFQKTKYTQAEDDRTKVDAMVSRAGGLDQKWSGEIQTAGETERKLIGNLNGMIVDRDVWRNLLKDIEDAVPKPSNPDLLTGLKTGNVELIKKVPRADREQVVMRILWSKYSPTVKDKLTPPLTPAFVNELASWVQQNEQAKPGPLTPADATSTQQVPDDTPPDSAAADPAATPPEKPAGFMMVIEATSPFKDALTKLAEPTFTDSLKKIAPSAARPNLRYKVTRAILLPGGTQIKDSPRKAEIQRAYNDAVGRRATAAPTPGAAPAAPRPAGGGMPVAGGAAPAPAAGAVNEADEAWAKDRLITSESVLDDYDFRILLIVELDPDPYKPAPAAQANAQ